MDEQDSPRDASHFFSLHQVLILAIMFPMLKTEVDKDPNLANQHIRVIVDLHT